MTEQGEDPNRYWDGQRWLTRDATGQPLWWDGAAWQPIPRPSWWSRRSVGEKAALGAVIALLVIGTVVGLVDGPDFNPQPTVAAPSEPPVSTPRSTPTPKPLTRAEAAIVELEKRDFYCSGLPTGGLVRCELGDESLVIYVADDGIAGTAREETLRAIGATCGLGESPTVPGQLVPYSFEPCE